MAVSDRHYMSIALRLARRGLGQVWPNPAVGCVLVAHDADGARIVGRGWTRPGGRPHAEAEALRRAAEAFGDGAARGAVAYVSLEPCDHQGKTPPCTEALLAAGIGRVVVACEDPDPRVSGAGLRRLRQAGVEVVTGLCEAEARALNAGFFLRHERGRPLVTLKCAATLDGRIATRGGKSQWITGEAARARAHLMRAQHDAIAIGVGTALADDPSLTCRLPGLAVRAPVRVVVDSRLRLPLTAKLVATANATPTWLLTLKGNDARRLGAYRDAGVEAIEVADDQDGRVALAPALAALAARGITRLLVEGGAELSAGLLQADLVDRLAWFRAPALIGGDGIAAVAPLGVEALAEAPRFRLGERTVLGEDVLETYARKD